jgi:hypothetical protein
MVVHAIAQFLSRVELHVKRAIPKARPPPLWMATDGLRTLVHGVVGIPMVHVDALSNRLFQTLD